MIDFTDYVYYDETSPTFLRWKITRRGCKVGAIAGGIIKAHKGCIVVRINGHCMPVPRLVCMLHGYKVSKEDSVFFKDGNRLNCKIDNLEIAKWEHKVQQNKLAASRDW